MYSDFIKEAEKDTNVTLSNEGSLKYTTSGDEFIDTFKREASICGLTKANCGKYKKYDGTYENGKKNAIKLFSEYGPLWFAHDCGLYNGSGYHAILMIGYDTKNIYF